MVWFLCCKYSLYDQGDWGIVCTLSPFTASARIHSDSRGSDMGMSWSSTSDGKGSLRVIGRSSYCTGVDERDVSCDSRNFSMNREPAVSLPCALRGAIGRLTTTVEVELRTVGGEFCRVNGLSTPLRIVLLLAHGAFLSSSVAFWEDSTSSVGREGVGAIPDSGDWSLFEENAGTVGSWNHSTEYTVSCHMSVWTRLCAIVAKNRAKKYVEAA
jgi:hypothetical protein